MSKTRTTDEAGDVRRKKYVRFVLYEGTAERRVVRYCIDEIFQEAQYYRTQGLETPLSTALYARLGLPSSVTITKVSGRDNNNHQKISFGRIGGGLEYIREDNELCIWLETSSAAQNNHNNKDRADYASHPVLQLEAWVNDLTEQEVEYAKSLFTLLRRNHRHSRDFMEDLTALFTPLRERDTATSERSRSLLETFESQSEALSQASHVERIESLAAELDGTSAEDARAILHLVRRGFGTCRDYMDELKVIFGPLQQRNKEELERAVQIMKVFEAIDKEGGNMSIG